MSMWDQTETAVKNSEAIFWSHVEIEDSESSDSDTDNSLMSDRHAYYLDTNNEHVKVSWSNERPFQSINSEVSHFRRHSKDLAEEDGGSVTDIVSNENIRRCPFTYSEELDIHCRAELYVNSIEPDPDYFHWCGSRCSEHSKNVSYTWPGYRCAENSMDQHNEHDIMMMMPAINKKSSQNYKHCIRTEDGSQLLKPSAMLVELVAQALNGSPDCMLQVQQVYLVLQRRYPYFQHLDKATITSWKSSVRHALYQKWFQKVHFSSEFISVRGCYWTINRNNKPKDWSLPNRCDGFLLPVDPEYQSLTDVDWLSRTGSDSDNEQVQVKRELHRDLTEYPTITCTDDMLSSDILDLCQDIKLPCYHGETKKKQFDLRNHPDPILNDLNNLTQSSSQCDSILEIDRDCDASQCSDDSWTTFTTNLDTCVDTSSVGLLAEFLPYAHLYDLIPNNNFTGDRGDPSLDGSIGIFDQS